MAVLGQKEGIAGPVLQATGVDPGIIKAEAEAIVDGFPSAKGQGMANPTFNRDSLTVLNDAHELAGELGDHYTSTEVILAAIAKGSSDAAQLLQSRGATTSAN